MSSETVYYDINQKRFIYNTTGVELALKDYPSITFKEQKIITWYIGSWNFTTNAWVATNLTAFGVTAWQSSVDYDFLTATDPMVRVLNANIDSSNSATGIIVVTYDADTTAFEDAVEAQTSGQRQIYIELKGYNVSGKLAFFARPRLAQIYGEMQLDPGTDPTGTTATNYYTKSEVDAKIITSKQAVSIADSATSNLTLFDHTLTSGCTFEFVFSDTVNTNRISGKISIETDHTIRVNDLEHDYNSTEAITVTIGAFDLSGNNVRFNITNDSGNTITGELTIKDTVVVSASVSAAAITVTDEHADTTSFPLFASSATGVDIVPHTNSGLTYEAHTYNLATTTFTGALVGNANTATTASAVTNATLTTALTVKTGTVTLTGSAANTSVLTIGAGAVGVSGSNTGDQANISGNAATVTTNANLTGPVTSTGNATAIAANAIKANMLQNAAADLGAANVSVNLSNSNGSYVTNLILDGSLGLGGSAVVAGYTVSAENATDTRAFHCYLSTAGAAHVYGVFCGAVGASTINSGIYAVAASGTTNYCVEIYALAAGANNYAIYSHGTAKTYLNGSVGIGQNAPTAYLHIKAGTTGASTAPIKLTTGTVNTTAEAGAIEYNNTFWVTNSDATRRGVVTAVTHTKTTASAPYDNNGYITININGNDVKVMTTA